MAGGTRPTRLPPPAHPGRTQRGRHPHYGNYFLINRYSGLSHGVDEGSTIDGANIEQQPYASQTRQQWQIIPS
ncbi:RICIN domain-containing protein [Streptomyces flaveus]|uniref:RICIN domain-containing protein n=1 Tax=Streptomyces flaveus TaxID=66370 RepID=UPI0016714F92|nr:RICIN domain-containing protein [Streptomyces flaveus]